MLAYRVKIPDQWKIHLVFHATLLTEYKEMELHGPNFLKPPPEVVNNEEHYDVEAILDSKRQGRGTKYLIKWEGYLEADNTWEPYTLLKGTAEEALWEFHKAYPDKP